MISDKKIRELHHDGYKYDFSRDLYINWLTKVIITREVCAKWATKKLNSALKTACPSVWTIISDNMDVNIQTELLMEILNEK